jgi:hypothetical protein
VVPPPARRQVLLPILARNAAVRRYQALVEATRAARVLQAARRGAWQRNAQQARRAAAVELQRVVRMAASFREAEEALARDELAAAAALRAECDPSGLGLWEEGSAWGCEEAVRLLLQVRAVRLSCPLCLSLSLCLFVSLVFLSVPLI